MDVVWQDIIEYKCPAGMIYRAKMIHLLKFS